MSSHDIIDFNQTRNFSAKMNATYGFIRQNFKGLTKSLLIIAGPPVLISGIFFIDIFQRMMAASTGAEAPGAFSTIDDLQSASFVLQFFGILLFMLVGGVSTVSTCFAYVYLYYEKKSTAIDVRDVWQRVRKTFWMNFLGMIGFSFFLILALIILLIPLAILMYLFATISPFLIIVVYLGYYLLAFFLMINFSMIFVIQNFELIGFFKSIDKIFSLNSGKWWSTFGIGAVNVYVQYVFSFLLFMPGYIILIIQSTHTLDTPFSEPNFFTQLIMSVSFVLYFLASILLATLPLIGLVFQYFNLVESKLARGLMARIETLGQADTITDHHGEY